MVTTDPGVSLYRSIAALTVPFLLFGDLLEGFRWGWLENGRLSN